MAYVVVEYEFDPPLTEEALAGAFNALKPCLEVRDVKRLRSSFSNDGRRGFCEYEAADAQALRDAYAIAKVPFARIWAGQRHEFGTP
jgi:hypothetical protein